MSEIAFTIPGRIGGWQRAGRRHLGGGKAISFTPKKMRSDQAVVRHFAAQAMRGKPLMDGPLSLDIEIFKLVPRSWSAKKRAAAIGTYVTGTPDCSNRLKNVEDAMNRVVYRDDSQIAKLNVVRFYHDNAESMTVRVSSLAGCRRDDWSTFGGVPIT